MCAEQGGGQKIRYKACIISDMLNNDTKYWYFQCATPAIMESERVNAFFQATDADSQDLEKELALHYKSLSSRILDKSGRRLRSCEVDYGARFVMEISKYLESHQDAEAKLKVKVWSMVPIV